MQGPSLAALAAAALWLGLGLAAPPGAVAGHDAVTRARALLARNDPRAAVTLLEQALPTAGADLGPMIVVLRQAYSRAAESAAKAGRADEAEAYKENLQILNRKMRGRPDEPAAVAPTPAQAPPADAPRIDEPKPRPIEPAPIDPPIPVDPEPPAPRPLPIDAPVAEPEPGSKVDPEVKRAVVEPVADDPAQATAHALAEADRAYLSERYLDAGKGYAALAKVGRLPEERKLHWAYCRSVDVVRRIKAKPLTPGEWASIDREIVEIKALSPKYWYAEYLRNRAADQSRGVSRAPQGRIVRGAMPETAAETEAVGSTVPARSPLGSSPKPGSGAIAMAIPPTDTPRTVSTHGDSGNWQLKETANFAIYHADPDLAEKVAAIAEATRDAATRRWSGSPPARAWSPRCEIYLYPTAAIFAQVTGQSAESPGFSTMEASGGRVTGRRIKLRADHPLLVAAVVPHEVTHVILADLFPVQQVPRWADEGIAVLSEPTPEQDKRIADLDAALNGGRIFSVEHLMVRDYPEGPYWALYYAQSVSLTRYLTDQGSPAQLIDFLQASQRSGNVETELRRVYRIEGYPDLQKRWLVYARSASTARLASAREATVR